MMCGSKNRGCANDHGGRRAGKAAQKLGSPQMSGHRELLCSDIERRIRAGVPFGSHVPQRLFRQVATDLCRQTVAIDQRIDLAGQAAA
jgi:hypothetical protein